MTATELIEQLQKQVEEHGDLEVDVETRCGSRSICEVYTEPRFMSITIRLLEAF